MQHACYTVIVISHEPLGGLCSSFACWFTWPIRIDTVDFSTIASVLWVQDVFLLNTMTTIWLPWKPMPLAPAGSRPWPSCRVWMRSVHKRPRRCGTDGQTDGRTNPNYSVMIVPLEQCHHKPIGMYCGGLLVHIKETTPICPHKFVMELFHWHRVCKIGEDKLHRLMWWP